MADEDAPPDPGEICDASAEFPVDTVPAGGACKAPYLGGDPDDE